MTRKKKTTVDPGDWTANLADFDYDQVAYSAALQAHLEAKGDANGVTDDGSGDS